MSQAYEFGPFRLDPPSGLLYRAGHPVHVTAKGYAVLLLLIERAGSLVSKEEILNKVWPDGFVEPANLTQTIYVLRKTLGDAQNTVIETVPGRGYRFAAPVRGVNAATALPAVKPASTSVARMVWFAAAIIALLATLGLQASVPIGASKITIDPKAKGDYVIGRHFWSERTMASMRTGLRYFQNAVRISPNYAQGYAGIADSYATIGDYSPPGPRQRQYFNLARAAALRAVALDPQAGEPHTSLAFVDEFLGKQYASEVVSEYRLSLELDPNYATAHEWYSWYLFDHGQTTAALAEITRAHELDPLSPVINFAVGTQLYYTRRYKESADQWHETIALIPDAEMSYYGAGLADEQLRHNALAEGEFRRALELAPNDPDAISALAHVYALSRDPNAAQHLLARISTIKPIPGYDIALVKEALGEHVQAMHWLEFAKLHHDDNLMELSLDPRMDKLRRQAGMARWS